MEAAGFAIGVVGLVGLFQVFLDVADVIITGQSYSNDLVLLHTNYQAQWFRFFIWSRAMGLLGDQKLASLFNDPLSKEVIRNQILAIKRVVSDAKELQKIYGIREVLNDAEIEEVLHSDSPFNIYKSMIRKSQKQASVYTKSRWVIRDKEGFSKLENDLRKLVDNLINITKEVKELEDARTKQMNRDMKQVSIKPIDRFLRATGSAEEIADAAHKLKVNSSAPF